MKKNAFLLLFLLLTAGGMIVFSNDMRQGAYNGLVLAQNTIIPSLLPILIVFLLIIKTGAKDALAKAFGFIAVYLFNLPKAAFPAIFLGLLGGYPTGALLTYELFKNNEIDRTQARAMLRFNFCGGCGFIITAVGSGTLSSLRSGLILFASNVISSVIIGFSMSFAGKRVGAEFYSFGENESFSLALTDAADEALKSVLNITVFVVLFGGLNNIVTLPNFLLPVFEITNGICTSQSFSLPEISAYLAFGGFCIHLQLLPVILKCKMKYSEFLASRAVGGLISYCVTKMLLLAFPVETAVFSNSSSQTAVFSSVNLGLSVLLIVGCFVLILDVNSRKRAIDK